MNPEIPRDPPESLESRLTALILGELPPEEAARLQQTLEHDPKLSALHHRLEATVALVREAALLPGESDSSTAPKLAEDRRRQLFAQFKTVPVRDLIAERPQAQWGLPLAIAALLIGLLALPLFLPAWSKAKYKSRDYALTTREPAAASEPAASTLSVVEEQKTPAYRNHPATAAASVKSQDGLVPERLLRRSSPVELKDAIADRAKNLPTSDAGVAGAKVQAEGEIARQETKLGFATAPAAVPTLGDAPQVGKRFARQDALPAQQEARKIETPIAALPSQPALESELARKSDGEEASSVDRLQSATAGLEKAGAFRQQENQVHFYSETLAKPALQEESFAAATPPAPNKGPTPEVLGKANDLAVVTPDGGDLKQKIAGANAFGLAYGGGIATNGAVGGFGGAAAAGFDTQSAAAGRLYAVEPQDVALIEQLGERLPESERADASRGADLYAKSRAVNERDLPASAPAMPTPIPQPEVLTRENAFSTFSLNVSDVSFKLAAASLENGALPAAAAIRSEEFLNAVDYRDPEAAPGLPLAFAWERARWPFAHNRDLLRLSLKTASLGRASGQPLNLVLLLDNSGSMERADRVEIVQQALRVLAGELQPQDKFSLITFARTPRVWVDGLSGSEAPKALQEASRLSPEGGTNLEDGLNQAYAIAHRHYQANSNNRVVLLTDGAANLGNIDPEALKAAVEAQRKQGIALDCFGIGWEGYNDDLLENLSRNGDGRYGFINSPQEAATGFAAQLAGALKVFASNVKVQVQFNPERVNAYRQVGYAKHQLTKEQFRNNAVDAAELGAAESGTAAYILEVNPSGQGPLGTVRVRYRDPQTDVYREQEWLVPFTGSAPALEEASPSLRLAGTAVGLSEWLAGSPYAGEITLDQLANLIRGVPPAFGSDPRPQQLELMIRQAKSIGGQ